jgi:hypothetical protein
VLMGDLKCVRVELERSPPHLFLYLFVGVLEPGGCIEMGQVNDAVRRSLRWLCKADIRCILVRVKHPYV